MRILADDLKDVERLTPGGAVRKFCIECVGSMADVPKCQGDKCRNCSQGAVCYFFPYRMRKGRPSVKLLHKMCVECQGGSGKFVRECSEKECTLWPWRFGKNPYISEETREKLRERATRNGFGRHAAVVS